MIIYRNTIQGNIGSILIRHVTNIGSILIRHMTNIQPQFISTGVGNFNKLFILAIYLQVQCHTPLVAISYFEIQANSISATGTTLATYSSKAGLQAHTMHRTEHTIFIIEKHIQLQKIIQKHSIFKTLTYIRSRYIKRLSAANLFAVCCHESHSIIQVLQFFNVFISLNFYTYHTP